MFPDVAEIPQFSYYYDGRVHVIPEFDGIRLLTNEGCEFLHKVTGECLENDIRTSHLFLHI
jgi:hypothetical protein